MRLSGNGRSGSTRGSGAGNVRRCTGWGASPAAIPTCSSCGGRACGRRLECRSRMRRESHVRFWEGGGVQFPSATRLVMAFETFPDATRVLGVLGKRLARYGLTLHPDKTRLIDFRFKRPEGTHHPAARGTTFDFLGFAHVWGKSRKGVNVVRQVTAKGRYARALAGVTDWCRDPCLRRPSRGTPLLEERMRRPEPHEKDLPVRNRNASDRQPTVADPRVERAERTVEAMGQLRYGHL